MQKQLILVSKKIVCVNCYYYQEQPHYHLRHKKTNPSAN